MSGIVTTLFDRDRRGRRGAGRADTDSHTGRMLARWTGKITMSDLDPQLPPHLRRHRDRRTVVVIADRRSQVKQLQIPRSAWAESPVVTVVGRSAAELHDVLAAQSEVGFVLDVRTSSGSRQREAFRKGFFHLGRRDIWVSLREPGLPRGSEPLVRLARRMRRPDVRREVGQPWRRFARAVARVKVTPDLVLIVKKQKHVLLLREDGALPLLRSREPGLRVTRLAQLDAGVLEVGDRTTDYGRLPTIQVPDVLPYPVHTVRRYEGLIHLPKDSLAHHGRTVLPDSFRWHLAPQLRSLGLRTVDDHFGRLLKQPEGETLEGSYFLFLYNNPGHFGHLMTEALSKLWGWWPAKAADPSLKILCRLHPVREETTETRAEATLFPAFGIDRQDIVWVDGPVSVTSLVGCTPMWHNAPPFYVHPGILDTWARIRTGLIGDGPVAGAERIFVTRSVGNRPCSNVDAVEALFVAHGFTVVSPQFLSLPEQVATFAAARVVAGFGGAGMFNLVYSHAVETVIVLNQWAYEARNEHLFAAVHGAQLHSFWSPPNVDHPPGGSSYDAHQSGWTFDMERLEQPLNALLESLPD
jgi:capsular polysaccharide biosynthesis protein